MSQTLGAARRAFLERCGALGVASTLFPGVLWAKVAAGEEITDASIAAAAEIAGVSFSDEERALMLTGLKQQTAQLDALHKIPLDNAVAPAMIFTPLPHADAVPKGPQRPIAMSRQTAKSAPADLGALAYAPLTELADLVRRKQVTSVQLTTMYLDRLTRLDPQLLCATTITRERALTQARAADAEIAAGRGK